MNEGLTTLTEETLNVLNMESHNENPQQNATQKRKRLELDLYDPDRPKPMVDTVQISAADLCSLISKQLKHYFQDVLGCSFKPMANGNREFVILFQPGKGFGNIPNIDAIRMNASMPSTQKYIETMRVNMNGRHTMTLNQITKDFFEKYMIRPVIGNPLSGNLKIADKIDWNKCIEEVSYKEASVYSYNQSSFLMLRNIDLERLLHDIWIPLEERKAEREAAIINFKKAYFTPVREVRPVVDNAGNPVLDPKTSEQEQREFEIWKPKSSSGFNKEFHLIDPSEYEKKLNIKATHEVKVIFKGYRVVANNHVAYYPTPMSVMPNGVITQANAYDLRNLFVNIEVVDLNEAAKITPLVINSNPALANVF